jgi:hypothetical protein
MRDTSGPSSQYEREKDTMMAIEMTMNEPAEGFVGGPLRDARGIVSSWHCTAMFPWFPECHISGAHPEAREVDWYDDGEDCIGVYRCPNCDKTFRQIIPR